MNTYLRAIFSIVVAAVSVHGASAAGYEPTDSVLTIPAGVKVIDEFEYMGRADIREVRLPRSVVSVGVGAFRDCPNLRSVTMPGVTRIPKECFCDCPRLSSLTLSRRLADIGALAFAYCESLPAFYFPATLTHIGNNAFSFCLSLTEVRLPASITELESYAFSECTSLRHITLPGNPKLLGELILSGCRAMQSIEEPSAVPPEFDCNSQLFEDNESQMYDTVTLRVPTPNRYRDTTPWSRFNCITPIRE